MRQNFFYILFFFCNVLAHSQTNEVAKIDILFKHWNTLITPGCAVGIIKDNKVAFTKCYGMANLDNNISINNNTKFITASLTKQFTAYCIAILISQGKLSLEDDIRTYLPEFPYSKDTLRIKHLIYHTNGLHDYSALMSICGDSYDDLNYEHMIKEKVYSISVSKFKPGEKFEYSNSGYYLLSEIIEHVSQLRIDEFARKYIFSPLGMNDTFFYTNPRAKSNNMAVSYTQNIFGDYQKQYSTTPPFGSGNLISTLHDLLLWEQNFYNGKLSKNKLNYLILKQGVLNKGDTIDYCFGLKIGKHKELKIIYHFGDYNSFESVIIRVPKYKLSVIILANDKIAKTYFDNYSLADKIIDIFLDQSSNPKIPENRFKPFSSEESIKKYIGVYKSKNGITSISYDEGQLKLSHSWGNWYYSIFPTSDSVFCDEYDFEYTYKFKINDNKDVMGLWTQHTGYIEKINADSVLKLSNDYSGAYYSKELNTVYKLYQEKGKIYCKINSKASKELIITGRDTFRLDKNVIKLIRNDSKIINRIEVNNEYVFKKL